MHYSFELIILASNTISNMSSTKIVLGAGIIRHVSFVFPAGCARYAHVCLRDRSQQILPTNPEASYYEDAYSVEADCYVEMKGVGNTFWLFGWNVGSQYTHTIHVLIDVEGIDEPTPNKSVLVLAEAINNLVQLMRSWF